MLAAPFVSDRTPEPRVDPSASDDTSREIPAPVQEASAPVVQRDPGQDEISRHESVAMPHNAPEIPRVSLELPPDSGLVLVETSHAAAPAADESEAEMQRPRRVRPPPVVIDETPLQLVETVHKEPEPPAQDERPSP